MSNPIGPARVRQIVARGVFGLIVWPSFIVVAALAFILFVPLCLLMEATSSEPEWSAPFEMVWDLATAPRDLLEDFA